MNNFNNDDKVLLHKDKVLIVSKDNKIAKAEIIEGQTIVKFENDDQINISNVQQGMLLVLSKDGTILKRGLQSNHLRMINKPLSSI